MPNHITNIIKIESLGDHTLAEIRSGFLDSEGFVDFNVISPAPNCLKEFMPHMGILGRAKAALGLVPAIENTECNSLTDATARLEFGNCVRDISTPTKPEDIPDVIRAIQNYSECGYMHWFDWNCEHWGTKWNAYGQPDDGFTEKSTEFSFETAWSHPSKLIEKLSKSLATAEFSIKFADEDTGSNCGTYKIKNGERSDENIAPKYHDMTELQKRQYTEMAFRITNGNADPASGGYDENWQYSDEIYDAYEAANA